MKTLLIATLSLCALATHAHAQEAASASDVSQEAAPETESDALKVFFPSGSARIGPDQAATLDLAARTFRDGDPYVMIVSGLADTVGSPEANLALSLQRASAVAEALSARGIPVERLQVLGRGNSELAVQTGDGVAERQNRQVEITWR